MNSLPLLLNSYICRINEQIPCILTCLCVCVRVCVYAACNVGPTMSPTEFYTKKTVFTILKPER
jgi:hypothetical protein